jgi:hypothetical protein
MRSEMTRMTGVTETNGGEEMKRANFRNILCVLLTLMAGTGYACGEGGGEEPGDVLVEEQTPTPPACNPADRPQVPDGLAVNCRKAVCSNGFWTLEPQDGLTCWTPTCIGGAGGEGKGTCLEGSCVITAPDGSHVPVATPEEATAVEQQFADEHAGPCDLPPDCQAWEKEPAVPMCSEAKATPTADGNCYCENHFSLSTCSKPLTKKIWTDTIPERGQVIAVTLEGCDDVDDLRPVQTNVAVRNTGTGEVLKTAIVTTPQEAVHSDFSIVKVPLPGSPDYRYEVVYVSDGGMFMWDFTWQPDVEGGRFVHDSLPKPFLEGKFAAVSRVSMVRIGDANVVAFLESEEDDGDVCAWVAQADGKGAPVYVACGSISQVNLALVDGDDLVVSLVDTVGNVSFQRLSKKLSYEGDCSSVGDVKCDPAQPVEVAYCPTCGTNPGVYVACSAPEVGGGIWIGVLKEDPKGAKVEPWHELESGYHPSLAIVAPGGNVYLLYEADGQQGGGRTSFLLRIDYKLAVPLGPTKVLGELTWDRTMSRIDRIVEQGGAEATVVISGTNMQAEPEYFSLTVVLKD